jgi:hypothetical protein
VAQLLFTCPSARKDIQPTVAFRTTRVRSPDEDDWNKLKRVLRYIRCTIHLPLILRADSLTIVKWWVDASFATHGDCRGHTGETMSMGRGSMSSMSKNQKINTRSSTEAELIGADNAMPQIIWTKYFIEAQGQGISDNILYQDNLSTMLLEKNGKQSSSKRTTRYFFIKDGVDSGDLTIKHCLGTILRSPCKGHCFTNSGQRFKESLLTSPMWSWAGIERKNTRELREAPPIPAHRSVLGKLPRQSPRKRD